MTTFLRRPWLASVALISLALTSLATPVEAFTPSSDVPGYGYFHTYTEVKQAIDRAVAEHPGIARRFNIGQTYEGRKIWGIKISDNVGTDENEPEVFIDANMHARERATTELALDIMHTLVDNYGHSDNLGKRVTAIVNSREVWIVPSLNPDGAEFDISGGHFHRWRKNRQPISGSQHIGVDLNRQFGYKWACCGGSSPNPKSDTYHGPYAWFAPEARRYRGFVNSRVKNGRQQIRVTLDLHCCGRLVLWPYAYTRKDVPPDMNPDDYAAMSALGRDMARLSGYKPMQGSDLYIVDGDKEDWSYHEHRIAAMAIEMARGSAKRYYPSLSELTADIARNRPMVLLLLEQADCVYRAAGLEDRHC